jgi:regulatory protein
MSFIKKITKEQALQKAKHFCAYQERNHQEVKEKLYGFGLYKKDVETILSELIELDYLNEERFATSYARGRFRIKQWGRVKIKYELKQKNISEYCIKKALTAIDEKEYEKTLHKLAAQKWKSVKGERNRFTKLAKTQAYLLQKGYEPVLTKNILAQIENE